MSTAVEAAAVSAMRPRSVKACASRGQGALARRERVRRGKRGPRAWTEYLNAPARIEPVKFNDDDEEVPRARAQTAGDRFPLLGGAMTFSCRL
jgi:hypothetical protein